MTDMRAWSIGEHVPTKTPAELLAGLRKMLDSSGAVGAALTRAEVEQCVAALEALENSLGTGEIWRHWKRGGEYEIVGPARLQTNSALYDMAALVVYRHVYSTNLWVRGRDEFYDGRFIRTALLSRASDRSVVILGGATWRRVADHPPPQKRTLMVSGDSGYRGISKFLTLARVDEEFRPSLGGPLRWVDHAGDSLMGSGWTPEWWALPIALPGESS